MSVNLVYGVVGIAVVVLVAVIIIVIIESKLYD